ncbi:MAG: 30S ribosomal protein S1 [Acidimicrobiia bacterium]
MAQDNEANKNDGGSVAVVERDLTPEETDQLIDSSLPRFTNGDIVAGTIVKVERDEVLVDIGYKSEGVIPARELSIRQDVDPRDIVQEGDRIEALVLDKEDAEGRLVLSKKRAQYEKAWIDIEKIRETTGIVAGPVIEVVKGGLILDIGLRGFLPASLVDLRKVKDLQSYVGQILECKIIELDRNRNNVVLSRKAYLEESQRERRTAFLESLQPGERRKGVVSSVVSFGVFVDLGGMDGLVHVSEISWRHVEHPSEVVKVGDEVEVEVLDVDKESQKISLSMKACQEDPWEVFAREHSKGSVVQGRVSKIVPYGAFIEVADGIEGLVHISEMAHYHVQQPQQVVSVGDTVKVKVIEIDLARRRISLSIKQALEEEGGEEYSESGENSDRELIASEATSSEVAEAQEVDVAAEQKASEGLHTKESEESGTTQTGSLASEESPSERAEALSTPAHGRPVEDVETIPLETSESPSEAVEAIAAEIREGES